MACSIAATSSFSSSSSSLITSNKKQIGFVTIKRGNSSSNGMKLAVRSHLQMCHAVAEAATFETVQKVIASQLAVDQTDVKPESKFADLGADSLDTVEIMMNLEESFKISLGEEGAEKITTVQDAADLIQEVISKKKGSH